MATLPNIPVNSAITFGTMVVVGLVAYQSKLRTEIESQIHRNYMDMKLVDAGVTPETTQLKLTKSDNR